MVDNSNNLFSYHNISRNLINEMKLKNLRAIFFRSGKS